MKILELYGKASNAKVNLNKTVVVSLSGYPHSSWKTLLQPLEIKWHDDKEKKAIVQLGYLMYSSQVQLQDFLDGLEMRIKRHIDMLKGRHLSIRGAGILANSTILSKLWHVLRVIVVPPT